MMVKRGEQTDLEAPAAAEPADNLVWRDYYTQLPQIRLTGGASSATEINLDGNDVSELVACAIRHPEPNMRYAVLAAIWNHPDSFRQIFRFGLNAPEAFADIGKIVAEELAKCPSKPEFSTQPANTLLPRMPRPAHLQPKSKANRE
jgi:hypothetical protein